MAGDGDRSGDDEDDDIQKSEKNDEEVDGEAREEPEPLKDATRTALLEGRVVLTSITTLFGFQLNVVFTETFATKPRSTSRSSPR